MFRWGYSGIMIPSKTRNKYSAQEIIYPLKYVKRVSVLLFFIVIHIDNHNYIQCGPRKNGNKTARGNKPARFSKAIWFTFSSKSRTSSGKTHACTCERRGCHTRKRANSMPSHTRKILSKAVNQIHNER